MDRVEECIQLGHPSLYVHQSASQVGPFLQGLGSPAPSGQHLHSEAVMNLNAICGDAQQGPAPIMPFSADAQNSPALQPVPANAPSASRPTTHAPPTVMPLSTDAQFSPAPQADPANDALNSPALQPVPANAPRASRPTSNAPPTVMPLSTDAQFSPAPQADPANAPSGSRPTTNAPDPLPQAHDTWFDPQEPPTDPRTVFKTWYDEHAEHPYPNGRTYAILAELTGLELKEIKGWFVEERKKNGMAKSAKEIVAHLKAHLLSKEDQVKADGRLREKIRSGLSANIWQECLRGTPHPMVTGFTAQWTKNSPWIHGPGDCKDRPIAQSLDSRPS